MTYFLKGAIHLHTTFSDGTGNINEISKAAKEAGLDWIIITDHNKIAVEEGVYNGVYVLVGEEITPSSNSNHCIAFDIKKQIDNVEKPLEYFQEIKKQNGFSCICHPHERLERNNSYPAIRWEFGDFSIADGIEIWNYFSNWANEYDDSNLLTQAYYYFFGNFLKNEPLPETLETWDKMNDGVRVPKFAIGGLDSHAIKYRKFMMTFTVYPYLTLFKTVINVIPSKEKLPHDFEKAKNFILNSIKTSRFFVLDQRRGNNCEMYFYAHNKTLACTLGDSIEVDEDSEINVTLPKRAEIRLVKDGEYWLSAKRTKRANFKIKYPGTYRVEIYRYSQAWAFSNPIVFINKGGNTWTSENI